MKNAWMLRIAMSAAGLVTLGIPCAYAQAEIDPDHFAMPNTQPLQASNARTQTQSVQAAHNNAAMKAHSAEQLNESVSVGGNSAFVTSLGRKSKLARNPKTKAIRFEGGDTTQKAGTMLGLVLLVRKGEMRWPNQILAA